MPDGELMKDSEHKVKETKIIQKDNEVSILPAGGMGSHSEESIKSNLADKLRTLAEMLEDENYDNLEYVIYKSGAMESLVSALRQYQSFKNKRGNRPIKKDVEIDISNESGFSKELPTIDQEMDSYFNSRKTKNESIDPVNNIRQAMELERRAEAIWKRSVGRQFPWKSSAQKLRQLGKVIQAGQDPKKFIIDLNNFYNQYVGFIQKNKLPTELIRLLKQIQKLVVDLNKNLAEDYLPEDETLQEYVFQSRPLRVLDNIASRNDVQKFPIKFNDGTQVEVTPKMAKKFMEIYLRKDTDIQKLIDKKITQKEVFVQTFNDLIKGKRTTGLTLGDIR